MVPDGGGWYGGGGAANMTSLFGGTPSSGGGGGSGFILSESTVSNVPSGYLVTDKKYYLSNAGTYGPSETGFVENPVKDGNGYARITLIVKDVEETRSATRWINIEKQIANGTFTGTFTYNGNTITETDSAYNVLTHDGTN